MNIADKEIAVSEKDFANAVDLTANAAIVDCEMKTVAVGEHLRDAAGSAAKGDFIFSFIKGKDALRFEQFVRAAAPYKSLTTIALEVTGLRGYSRALACRRELFGTSVALVSFYKDNKEILAHAGTQFRPTFAGGEPGILDNAKRIIESLSDERPNDASTLRAALDDAVRRSLTADLICRIVTERFDHAPFDLASLAKRAADYVNGVLCADTVFSSVGGEAVCSIDPGVQPEHMWYLITSALTAVISLSDGNPASLCVSGGEDGVSMRFSALSASLAHRLPESVSLGELRELCPRSALRLYLCELICEENGISGKVTREGGEIAISLHVPAARDDRTFHSAEHIEPRPEWLVIAKQLIIEDAA